MMHRDRKNWGETAIRRARPPPDSERIKAKDGDGAETGNAERYGVRTYLCVCRTMRCEREVERGHVDHQERPILTLLLSENGGLPSAMQGSGQSHAGRTGRVT